MRLLRTTACACILLFASASSAAPPVEAASNPACVPGAQVQCACPGGSSSIQFCSNDGTRFEACACAPTPVVGPAAAPLVVVLTTPPARTERANPGLWVTGITFVMLGAVGVAGGVALISAGGGCSKSQPDDEGLCVAGGVMAPVAAVLLVAGIPMAMIGGKQVPTNGTASGLDWKPSVVTAPGGGGLRWTF